MNAPPALDVRMPNWWQRNWKWCVPVLAATALALFVAFALGIFFMVSGILKRTTPYTDAVQAARRSPEVAQLLGTPLHEGLMPSGQINTTNDTGEAHLRISLSGPRGEGTVQVDARRQAGVWHYQTLELQAPGHASIPLEAP